MLLSKLSSRLIFNVLILAVVFTSAADVYAAACCGGGSAIPSLITGDERASLTTSLSYSKIDTDVFSNGVWQKRTDDDVSQILKIDGSHIFKDRYQAGFSLPLQMRKRSGVQGGDSSGIADISGQVGYEYLTDWDYSYWRPRGVGFLSLTLPTGKSIYESESLGAIDARGRGFWAIGAGTALTKSWTVWDVNSIFEVHRAFDKTIENSQITGTIKPGYGGSLSLGTGYNLKDFRFGGSILWAYEDAINFEGSIPSVGSAQRFASGIASISQLFNKDWSWIFSYTDQTILGAPSNTTLSKSFALSLQKRWDR